MIRESVANFVHRDQKKMNEPLIFRSRRSPRILILISVLCIGVLALAVVLMNRKALWPSSKAGMRPFPSIEQLMAMSHDDLVLQDIAVGNLVCAEGLNGSEHLNIRTCVRQLDQWAETATRLTRNNEFRFPAQSQKTGNSINRWRCAALVQYLSQVVGLSFNPLLKQREFSQPDDTSYFHDSRDFFIHGLIIESNRGTCASMPVLFASVARRMGYPIKLVTTRNHLFARWDSSSETFNIELTDKFAQFKPDEFYRSFPSQLNPGEVERRGYLVSLSPERELSAFLHLRGMCLWSQGKLAETRDVFAASAQLDPDYKEQGQQNYFVIEVERQIKQGKEEIQGRP